MKIVWLKDSGAESGVVWGNGEKEFASVTQVCFPF